jgi:hypothetical protein
VLLTSHLCQTIVYSRDPSSVSVEKLPSTMQMMNHHEVGCRSGRANKVPVRGEHVTGDRSAIRAESGPCNESEMQGEASLGART